MKFLFSTLFILLLLHVGQAQNNQSWRGYFSYNGIKDVSQSSSKIFAASENALFSKSNITNDIKTTNTIDGLSGQTITTIHHSEAFNRTLIGYENGLMTVVNESDGTVKKLVDIINKQLPPNIKRINHFQEHEGIVYVSCDFGIVQFNLATLLFGDTYFIGNGGAEIRILQTTVFNGDIYAATANNGIRRADILNENLIDYNQWTEINPGNWSSVQAFGSELIAINTSGNIHRYNGVNFQAFTNLPEAAVDTKGNEAYLIVTTSSAVYIYNPQLAQILQINSSQVPEMDAVFSCATIIGNEVYIGTRENGVIISSLDNPLAFEFLRPDGPERNTIFAINAKSSSLWTVFGGYSATYNPYSYAGLSEPSRYGISKFADNQWLTIPYEELFEARALASIALNPNNENEVYITSFFSGVLKIESDVPTFLYTPVNSAPSGPEVHTVDNSVRINSAVFDRSGNLWITNTRVDNALKVLKSNGQWQTYPVESAFENFDVVDYDRMMIDKNGTKWIASSFGLLAFNETTNVFKKITEGPSEGNLPIRNTRAVAIDNRNQLWIGTTRGLRVLSSVDRYNSEEQLTTNAIIIIEEDVAQELLFEQFITDIVVDGANNKWIGTADAGIFQVSPNGQETLQRFTIDNSPLPSNSINDIDINPDTGEVFFATPKGMVSFKGTATEGNDDLKNVVVYPNPVRPEYFGTVKITGLLDNATIKITDIEGNLVHEVVSEGGTIEWDTTAFGKYKVASGVYLIFISAEDGIETKIKKVMIIR